MGAVGVRVRQDADLAEAQPERSSNPGSTPMATAMSWTSWEARTSVGSTSQVFRILPRRGRMAWNSRSRACLAEPPAESPSTRKSSLRSGSVEVQSASFPGRAGPWVTFLRVTMRPALSLAWAAPMASSAMRSASATCWLSHRLKASLTTPETKAAHSREDRRSLVWPENWGSISLTDRI
jgi:hypothetical protein